MAWFTQGSEEYGEHGEMLLHFFLDDEENDDRVVVRISELVRCLKHFRESVLSNDEHDYEYEMAGHLWAAPLEGGTLTAEQVRNAIRKYAHDDSCYIFEVYGEMCGLIADELNGELGRGTCEVECFDDGADEGMDGEWFSYAPPTLYLSCGHTATEKPNFCPVCGLAVKR